MKLFAWRLLVAGAGAVCALLAGVAQAASEPIRLGLVEGLSGPFANAGEAVARNLQFAVERVNARGGVRLPGGARPLKLELFDSKGQVEEALLLQRRVADERIAYVLQGNSSAVAAALIEGVNKHNERHPEARMLLLNFSAVDPSLTNERCSPWHFRFDAHADMRMAALAEVIAQDPGVRRVYLINQDYSFGQQVARSARAMLASRRPDVVIAGDELHPLGRVRDFSPYVAKIKASGADAVITGNWGNDLALLVRAARDQGLDAAFYTFYGNGLGSTTAIGDAGVGKVRAVAEWHGNAGGGMDRVYADFRARYPKPADDYFQARMVVLVEMLVRAIEAAGSTEAGTVAARLAGMRWGAGQGNPLGDVWMRPEDHQLQGPLVVSVMERAGRPPVVRDVEGSGYGFRTERAFAPGRLAQPSACRMPARG